MTCNAQTPVCIGRVDHQHHRKLRSQGGTNDPDNVIGVCAPCHHHIHHNPAESYARGLLVHSWDNPANIPITP